MSRGRWTRQIILLETELRISTPARLGVLSDTHALTARSSVTMECVYAFFRRAQVDLILHAGDAGGAAVLSALRQIAAVAVVRGNADPLDLIDTLPDRVRIEIGSQTLLLLHGHHGKTALAAARAAASPEIDVIVFGHSHHPLIEKKNGTLLFNPGSPTERRWNPHFGIGLIAVSDEGIAPDLILFDDPRHLVNVTP